MGYDYVFLEPLLSQGKPSSQSTTHSESHRSEKAFDGNLYQGESCASTKPETKAWLQVDLLKNALIKSVKIYGRENIYEKSLNHAEILVSDGGQFHTSRLCASFEYITNVNVIETYYCEPDAIGRYVRLINKDKPLRVCEMQVFGHFK